MILRALVVTALITDPDAAELVHGLRGISPVKVRFTATTRIKLAHVGPF